MKKLCIVALVVLLMLVSCAYDSYPPCAYEHEIFSSHLFIHKGVARNRVYSRLPTTVYNPYNYPITVTADGIDYVIAPLATLELKEEVPNA